MDKQDLKNQVAVITGAGSGIGRAVARELDSAGLRLVLSGRRRPRLISVAKSCSRAVVVAGDLLQGDQPEKLVEQAKAAWGGCDVVVNNAGMLEAGAIAEMDLDRMAQMVRVNVEAAFRLAYVAMRHFQSVGRGQLVNISSILAYKSRPGAGAYAGTKHAVRALSEALRLEVAQTPIRVSCVEPGMVMTELHDHMEIHPSRQLGMKHTLQPESVARAVRYVLEQPVGVHVANLTILPQDSPL